VDARDVERIVDFKAHDEAYLVPNVPLSTERHALRAAQARLLGTPASRCNGAIHARAHRCASRLARNTLA
jgi:hypothetical protein